MKNIFLLAIVAIFSFAFISCSKDNTNEDGTMYPTVVRINNSGFNPSTIEIQLTSSVSWVNDDNAIHTVTADDAAFESPDIALGKVYTLKFDQLDTIYYHCKYHPLEKGTVIVNPIR